MADQRLVERAAADLADRCACGCRPLWRRSSRSSAFSCKGHVETDTQFVKVITVRPVLHASRDPDAERPAQGDPPDSPSAPAREASQPAATGTAGRSVLRLVVWSMEVAKLVGVRMRGG